MTTITQNTLNYLLALILCMNSFLVIGQSLNNDILEFGFQTNTNSNSDMEDPYENNIDIGRVNLKESRIAENIRVDPCVFGSSEAQQGGFAVGYTASFETVGTDVNFTFTLLDCDKIGVVAFLWEQDPFTETQMDEGPALTFTKTLSGFTPGESIFFACKFAFAGGLAVTRYFEYQVGATCDSSSSDEEAPENFTATAGTVQAFTTELILNGTDNSGTVVYTITYGSNVKCKSVASGTQETLLIGALAPETVYSFDIVASDLAGNVSSNSSITVQVTTAEDTSTECEGTSADAQQESFSIGYNYEFVTNGTDVSFTFELLDDNKVGVVAFLWEQDPFTETQMDLVSGQTFSKTLSGFSANEVLSIGCKFAFQGGLAVTKYFSYTVGNDCVLSVNEQDLLGSVSIYPNPVKNILYVNSPKQNLTSIEVYSLLGQQVLQTSTNLSEINIGELANGLYMLKMYSGNSVIIKKFLKE